MTLCVTSFEGMTIKFPIQRFIVSGDSMLPSLKPGQNILVLCWFFKLEVGDLVVFKNRGTEMVKRIKKIHGRKYFVVGDNKVKSTDSRHFGWIDKKIIIGKILFNF